MMTGLLVLMDIKRLDNDEYMEVYLEDGKIVDFYKEKRGLGTFTLGLSQYFTKPWVNVHGERGCLNELVYKDLQEKVEVECLRCFGEEL